jgi:predicted DNA-binding transcriptional regulator YafY
MSKPAHPLIFEYTNWEGKIATRKVLPIKVWYGKTKWHPTEQWLLQALDLEKNEERQFALKDIHKFF